MNKTLLFCTSFSSTQEAWDYRYKRWLDFFIKSSLEKSQILIIDDGSPVLPNWTNLKIYNGPTIPPSSHEEFVLFHFNNRLGRNGVLNYPGWYRSFTFAATWAKVFNFNKIIHIESDTFVLSEKLITYINTLSSGWTSLYCTSQDFPETCIQIICEDQIKKFLKFSRHDYDINFKDKPIELFIPFTNIEKSFIGDRYGEIEGLNALPSGIDYAANIPSHWIQI